MDNIEFLLLHVLSVSTNLFSIIVHTPTLFNFREKVGKKKKKKSQRTIKPIRRITSLLTFLFQLSPPVKVASWLLQ